MHASKMTFLICYDDHRGFTDDVRKRFSDPARYNVISFHTRQEFLNHCKNEIENNSCKVAIIGVYETRDQFDKVLDLSMEVKKADPKTGLILLVPDEKMDDIKKIVKFNIDAYIPLNANTVLRLHNAVKKLISEYNLVIFRKRRNLSVYVMLGFLIISAIIIIISRLKLPEYF